MWRRFSFFFFFFYIFFCQFMFPESHFWAERTTPGSGFLLIRKKALQLPSFFAKCSLKQANQRKVVSVINYLSTAPLTLIEEVKVSSTILNPCTI
jgi:hypothetical protein